VRIPEVAVAEGAPVRHEAEDAYLKVVNCSKLFGAVKAIEDLSVSVRRGELLSLLGPSGCGKTTLLRAIAGLEPQSSGEIWIAGREVTGLPPSQRNFGILFQSYALFPNLSVFDNVGYGLSARGWPRRDLKARVGELLDLVGLANKADRYPGQLSGGQQQRVALARALAPSPELLLLDEPLSALDAQVRVYLRDEIRALQQRLGITTILVTHDQEEALAISDRIALMRAGRIEQSGTPTALYEQPASLFAAKFIGSSTSLPATVAADGAVLAGTVPFLVHGAMPARGTPVWLSFRPEELQLVAPGHAESNVFRLCVRAMSYRGASWRVMLAHPDPGAEPALLEAAFTAEQIRRFGVAMSSEVTVRIAPEHIKLFAR
jgi:iron(III) transport system ATP-binding protein